MEFKPPVAVRRRSTITNPGKSPEKPKKFHPGSQPLLVKAFEKEHGSPELELLLAKHPWLLVASLFALRQERETPGTLAFIYRNMVSFLRVLLIIKGLGGCMTFLSTLSFGKFLLCGTVSPSREREIWATFGPLSLCSFKPPRQCPQRLQCAFPACFLHHPSVPPLLLADKLFLVSCTLHPPPNGEPL